MPNVDKNNDNNQVKVPEKKSQKNRWLVGLHVYGGGLLFNSFNLSRELPDFGAVFALIFVPIGYYISSLLVSFTWKKIISKKYRIIIGFAFIPLYFAISILLVGFIDKVLF